MNDILCLSNWWLAHLCCVIGAQTSQLTNPTSVSFQVGTSALSISNYRPVSTARFWRLSLWPYIVMGEFFFIVLHCPNTRDIRPFGGLLCLRLEIQESTSTTRSLLDEINHDQHGVSVFPVMCHMIRYLYFCGPFGFFIDVCELCPVSPSNIWIFSGITNFNSVARGCSQSIRPYWPAAWCVLASYTRNLSRDASRGVEGRMLEDRVQSIHSSAWRRSQDRRPKRIFYMSTLKDNIQISR